MTIPDFQTIMQPLLELARDGKERSLAEIRHSLSCVFKLTQVELTELLPSGTQPIFNNRVAWASIYLQRAGLLKRPKRGWYQITERGLEVLKEKPQKINIIFLDKFPEFVEFRETKKDKTAIAATTDIETSEANPEEALESAFQELQHTLAQIFYRPLKSVLRSSSNGLL